MTIDLSMKVRDVALQNPRATSVLEELKIDYCCGGDKSLADACATAGIDLPKLQQMLADPATSGIASGGEPDFSELTLSGLIAHILETHHVYTKDEISTLPPLFDKVVEAHGRNHPELIAVGELFRHLCADLNPHMFKEEQILFPYIVSIEQVRLDKRPIPFAPFGTVQNPVRMMMMEHEMAGQILRQMREVSEDYVVPADACMSYLSLYQRLEAFERDLHQHIHLENNILFPRAISIEDEAKQAL